MTGSWSIVLYFEVKATTKIYKVSCFWAMLEISTKFPSELSLMVIFSSWLTLGAGSTKRNRLLFHPQGSPQSPLNERPWLPVWADLIEAFFYIQICVKVLTLWTAPTQSRRSEWKSEVSLWGWCRTWEEAQLESTGAAAPPPRGLSCRWEEEENLWGACICWKKIYNIHSSSSSSSLKLIP